MIHLIDHKHRVSYHLGVLASRVPEFIALGWEAGTRERRPSVGEEIVLMQWIGDGKPPMPENYP